MYVDIAIWLPIIRRSLRIRSGKGKLLELCQLRPWGTTWIISPSWAVYCMGQCSNRWAVRGQRHPMPLPRPMQPRRRTATARATTANDSVFGTESGVNGDGKMTTTGIEIVIVIVTVIVVTTRVDITMAGDMMSGGVTMTEIVGDTMTAVTMTADATTTIADGIGTVTGATDGTTTAGGTMIVVMDVMIRASVGMTTGVTGHLALQMKTSAARRVTAVQVKMDEATASQRALTL
mmetsp:Transcript_46235/g.76453  ORF Transcript_46235/g.76453 Transcript_46235/m.76453 type:complete len:234 (-) Transcript_46235:548-1249(-)